uniref:Odorant receptor 7 n=1 Tax=Apriona germarii TaxID=157307 RepID=A0A7H9SLJ2_APRGE|nr:odorant receptor 7 [Apriona germarii]
MLFRLFINYWYANEIMVQSSEIGMALYKSKWYEESLKLQKMMIIMLMRCNKELCLEIGPFAVMTLATFIGILKATYTYMTIIYR